MSGHGLLERILNDQSIVTGMLIVIAVCSLTFAYRHLRALPRPAPPVSYRPVSHGPETGPASAAGRSCAPARRGSLPG